MKDSLPLIVIVGPTASGKTGLSIKLAKKFNGEIADKFFNVEEINNIFKEYIGGNSDLWRKVWVIYTFLVWYDEYFN